MSNTESRSDGDGNSALAIVKKLGDLKLMARENVEEILGTKLKSTASATNPYFDVYQGVHKSSGWKTIELRFPKSRGGAIIILELFPETANTKDVIKVFGEPLEPLQPYVTAHGPSQNETLMKNKYLDKTLTWIFSNIGDLKSVTINSGR